jgi:3-oxoadipate enol-lactonase
MSFLAYDRQGHGPRVVLIHSLALDAHVWSRVVPLLDADVLTYDCRGHGRSGNGGTTDFTTKLFADDLAGLLDEVGWESATIVGCSMGGCVAQDFAINYPYRTDGLGLVDTTAWYGPDAPTSWAERARTARDRGIASLVGFQQKRWFSAGFLAHEGELLERLTKTFVANDIDGYAATCHLLGATDLREQLAGVDKPATVVVGEHDPATPVAMAEDLAKRLDDAPLTVIEGAQHLSPLEAPEQVAAAIAELLSRVDGVTGG